MTGIILPFLHQAVLHEAPANRNVQRSPHTSSRIRHSERKKR